MHTLYLVCTNSVFSLYPANSNLMKKAKVNLTLSVNNSKKISNGGTRKKKYPLCYFSFPL